MREATVSLFEFLPEVLSIVGDVPEEQAASYVRDTAIDFARRTGIMVDSYYQDLDAGVRQYSICGPDIDDEYIHAVHAVWLEQHLLPERKNVGPRCQAWQFVFPDRIFLNHNAGSYMSGGLRVDAVVVPTQRCPELRAAYYDQYKEVIIYGTAHRLLGMSASGWANAQMAQYYLAEYDKKLGECITEKHTRSGGGKIIVRPVKIL